MSKLEELGITQENFDEYFFDVRKAKKARKGQVMVKYEAMADLLDGQMKRDIMGLLMNSKKGGESASKVLDVLGGATYEDSLRIPKEIAEDLLAGFSEDEVAEKAYRYRLQHFFYTEKEYADAIVQDDPHWSKINLVNMDQFKENVKKIDEMMDKIEAEDDPTIEML